MTKKSRADTFTETTDELARALMLRAGTTDSVMAEMLRLMNDLNQRLRKIEQPEAHAVSSASDGTITHVEE